MLETKVILETVAGLEQEMIANRRKLHENPEPSGAELKTAAFIAAEMKKLGMEPIWIKEPLAAYYVLDTGRPGKTVALRADIDALSMPEDEQNLKGKKVCVSKVPGLCHACGSCSGRSGEISPAQQKTMGLLRSMALIGFGIYLAAMQAAPAGPSWAGKNPRSAHLSGLRGESQPLCSACGSCPGCSGETSPTQQKSHGALCSMALIGLGNYSMAMRVDAGSSC